METVIIISVIVIFIAGILILIRKGIYNAKEMPESFQDVDLSKIEQPRRDLLILLKEKELKEKRAVAFKDYSDVDEVDCSFMSHIV